MTTDTATLWDIYERAHAAFLALPSGSTLLDAGAAYRAWLSAHLTDSARASRMAGKRYSAVEGK